MYNSLQQIIDSRQFITTDALNQSGNRPAAFELQSRLCDLGLLDPEIDGDLRKPFGPVGKGDGQIGVNTRGAIHEFCRISGTEYLDSTVQPELLWAMIKARPETFLPLQFDNRPDDDAPTRFAKRILRYMRKKGYWIARSYNMYNIVYIEGMDADGTKNLDLHNQWNDRRIVFHILPGGKPQMIVNDQATTEPGRVFTRHPLNRQGAARIAFGQYKAWVDGLHKGIQPALVQRHNLRVHRDLNKDGFRNALDPIDIGRTFGINQHSTHPNRVPLLVNGYSAGCFVGRRYRYHLSFLDIVRRDVRYLQNKGYLFISTIISGDDLEREEPV